MNMPLRLALTASVLLSSTACLDQTPLDPALWEHLGMVEDSTLLDARVTYLGEQPLPIIAADDAAGGGAAVEVELKLLARIAPPVVAGVQLQASHVVRDGSRVYVGYNVRGETFRGGIDVFDQINTKHPRLRGQALFYDTEISAMDLSGGSLLLATATADESFPDPAVLEAVSVQGGGKRLSVGRRVPLTSFAATGVKAFGGEVYTTSGSNGHVTVLNGSLDPVFADPFPDARAIDANSQYIVAMRGTPGTLRVYDRRTRAHLRDISIGGASIPHSKSSLILSGSFVIAATGDGGVVVADVRSGAVLQRLPAPQLAGVPSGRSVSNGIAVYNDLLFVANGEGGLWVAAANGSLSNLSSTPALSFVGHIPLNGSANFLEVRGDRLFVAAGVAGLNIIGFDL